MKMQIGAMSVGDILDRGLKMLLARLPSYYAINVIVLLPYLLFQLAMPAWQTGPMTGRAAAGIFLSVPLLALLLLIILRPIGTAAILHIVAQEFIDQRASMGDAFRFAFHRFGRLLGASLLAGLIIGVGMFLCLVPGILFAIWYVFVGQVVVVEGLKGDRALARSKDLTSGHRMRVFGMFLLFIVIGGVLGYLAGLLNTVLPSTEMVPSASGPRIIINFGNYAIQTVVGVLVNILVESYGAICWTLFYFDLRNRKEGFDLELAARQQAAPAS